MVFLVGRTKKQTIVYAQENIYGQFTHITSQVLYAFYASSGGHTHSALGCVYGVADLVLQNCVKEHEDHCL